MAVDFALERDTRHQQPGGEVIRLELEGIGGDEASARDMRAIPRQHVFDVAI